MRRFIFYTLLQGLILFLLSCAGEKKDVSYQIPADVNIRECSLVSSEGGEHFAFINESAEGEQLVYDGKKGEVYTVIEAISMSPNGTNYAYLAVNGKSEIILKNEKEIARYDEGTVIRQGNRKTLQLLGDGSLIYTKRAPKKMKKVMKDGKPIDNSPYSTMPEVSKDGKHLLYWAVDGTGDFLVFDGKRKKIDGIPLFLSISGDGAHYGAVLSNGKDKNSVVIDGDEKLTFDSRLPVEQFILSEKGTHYILLQNDLATGGFTVKFDDKIIIVAGKVFRNSFAFSMDDRHYGFVMVKPDAKKVRIVLDGDEIPSFDPDYSNINECFTEGRKLVFDPTGEHLLYVAGAGTYQIVALDQKVQCRFDLYNTVIYEPFFSKDKEVCFLILDKIKKEIIMVSKGI